MVRLSNGTEHNPDMVTHARCQCSECGRYFTSSAQHAKHRIGEGTGRRCMEPREMAKKGFFLSDSGHWRTPPNPSGSPPPFQK